MNLLQTSRHFTVNVLQNAINVGLDNENDSFLYDGQGIRHSAVVVSNATLYDGHAAVSSGVIWSICESAGVALMNNGAATDNTYSEGVYPTAAWISPYGRVTVNGMLSDSVSGYVKVCALYNGYPYYKTLTLKRIVNGDKYDLVVDPSSIAYNPASYDTKTIKVYANVTTIGGTSQATVSETRNDGDIRLYARVGSEMVQVVNAINDSSDGNRRKHLITVDGQAASENEGIYLELRKYSNGTYTVEDYETVEIAKSVNGNSGKDAATLVFTPSMVTFQADRNGTVNSGQSFSSTVLLQLPDGTTAVPTISNENSSTDASCSKIGNVLTVAVDGSGYGMDDIIGFYSMTGTATINGVSYSANGSLKINVVKEGPQGPSGPSGTKGVDAERYWIEFQNGTREVRFREDNAGTVTGTPASDTLLLKHLKGSTEETFVIAPVGYTIQYLNDRGNWTTITPGSRNLESDLSDGEYSPAVYRLLKGSTELCRLSIHAVWEYQRMLIPAGAYTPKEYTQTPNTTPLVLLESNNSYNNTYWFLVAPTNKDGYSYIAPGANQQVWQQATEFEVILVNMLFANFAKLGGFIVYAYYFFSRYGVLVSPSGVEIVVSESNVSTQYSGKVPYGWFDANDPMADTRPSSGYKFRPTLCINGMTGAEYRAGGKVRISSDGDVVMNGIEVNNAVVNDSLMFSKVLRSSIDPSVMGANLFTYNDTTQEFTLDCDYFILTGAKRTSGFTISLPPASRFPKARVKIVNATYSGGNGVAALIEKSQITLNVEHRGTETKDDDAWGYIKNTFTAAIPFEVISGKNRPVIVGAPNITVATSDFGIVFDKYGMIELISCYNPWVSDGETYYAWMIVDARE